MKTRFLENLLRNTAAGLLVGFAAGMLLSLALDSSVSDDLKKLYTFVVSAILSLAAAALTLTGVFANIGNQRETDRRNREKKLIAARALLPASLSQICSVCAAGIRLSAELGAGQNRHRADFHETSIHPLRLPDGVIQVFRDIIELTEDRNISNRIAGILREYQVFFARWESEFSQSGRAILRVSSDVNERTAAWAYLYALSASLFPYARNEEDTVNYDVTEREIWAALASSGVIFDEEEMREAVGLYARTFCRRFRAVY